MSGRFLLKGGCVLTLDPKLRNHPQADVLIDGSRIAEVGPGLSARDAEVIDASDTIVIPGFVDTHRHLWTSLLGNLGGSDPFTPSIHGPHHGPDDVYAATLIGLLGAAEAGITTVVDWADIPLDDGFPEAALQAHADAGLRTVFVRAAPSWMEGPHDLDASTRRLIARPGTPDGGMTTIATGSRDVSHSDLDGLAGEWEAARASGARIHAHAGIDEPGEGGAVALAERGLLGDDVTLVHCSRLTDADLDAIAGSGTSVALSTSSEMGAGLGPPPIQGLIDRGIRPGLAGDAEQGTRGDMFTQMRATISLQHAILFDLKLAGKGGVPNLMSTREVIRYATADGARVAGLDGVTGSLTPGKQADVVVLRADRPNIVPVNDPIGAVVWGMDTSNVDWVFAAGRPLMRAGALTADVGAARDLAIRARLRVAEACGLLVEAGETA
jgi:5-methylthioadenosine/S-adenosylhomocysteine deaminase